MGERSRFGDEIPHWYLGIVMRNSQQGCGLYYRSRAKAAKAQAEIGAAMAESGDSVLALSDEYEGSSTFRVSDVLLAEVYQYHPHLIRQLALRREAILLEEEAKAEAYRRGRQSSS